LPPLKEPVEDVLGDVPVDDSGVDVLLMAELKREEELPERVEVEEPEEEGEELEEIGAEMLNWVVWESTVLTSPTGEAWKEYPEPGSTTGITTVTVPSEVVTIFFNANVLWKTSLVK